MCDTMSSTSCVVQDRPLPAKKKKKRRRQRSRGTGVLSRCTGAVQCSYVPQFADVACQADLISEWTDIVYIGSDEEEAEMRASRPTASASGRPEVSYGRDLCSQPVPEGGVFGRDKYISSFKEKNAERLSKKESTVPQQSAFIARRSYRR